MNRSLRLDPDRPPGGARTGSHRREGLRRYSVAHFLAALSLLLIAMPFVDDMENGNLIESVLTTLVFLSAVPAIGGRRRTLILAAALLLPALIGRWVSHFAPDSSVHTFTMLAALAFLGFVMSNLFRFILRAPRVNSEVVCAGIAGYLMLGILWALGFRLLEWLRPNSYAFSGGAMGGSMTGFNSVYFSFVSLSTLGFGEITPLTKPARMLAVVEALTGMFYMAILISRLVSLYSKGPPDGAHDRAN